MKRIVALALSLCFAGTSQAAEYTIDPSHSSVGFKVRHLAISSVPGKFGEFKGTFSFDPGNIEASKVEAQIVLRSDEFLAAGKFTAITFKSSKIEKVSDTEFKAFGDLTLHGVTRPVTLQVTYGGSATDPWGKERAAFLATTKINRKDFGLTWSKTLETGGLVVGEEVAITLEIEGVKA